MVIFCEEISLLLLLYFDIRDLFRKLERQMKLEKKILMNRRVYKVRVCDEQY